MDKKFIEQHLDEVVEALEALESYMCEGFDDLKIRALDGAYEITEVMQFCMDKTNDVCQIPFCAGRTNQMLFDYRSFFEHGEKLGKLYGEYHKQYLKELKQNGE